MQDDDTSNPGMLWVLDGQGLWTAKAGTHDRSCADCHGDARVSMKGVAGRYPAFEAKSGQAVTLERRIGMCRIEHQAAPGLPYESREMLALTTYVANQSRGLPISEPEPRMQGTIAHGHSLFSMRQGQLNLSCAQCHDDNWGKRLAGNLIPQGHPTGYPIYRLEWQTVGSLQRRLRNCMIGMRAEPYAYGSEELVALEAYLMWRGRGMPVETPAVRP